ncbi:MAG TPA: hypothetical protein VKZ53_08770 [Candidatus Angelobacter sp.]|nr:hypothetical protein [Candidatus Angelobacter sp.]
MADDPKSKLTMARFLLGEMQDEERETFEQAFLEDTDLLHALMEMESDFLDLYALGKLPQSEKERLERFFLADPHRRERLSFAHALAAYPADETAGASTPNIETQQKAWLRGFKFMALPVAAALFLAVSLGIAWLLMTNHALRTELEALRRKQTIDSQRAAILQRQVDTLTTELRGTNGLAQQAKVEAAPGLSQVSFTLQAHAVRASGAPPRLAIPASAKVVELSLIFSSDPFVHYHVFLETAEGNRLWQRDDTKSNYFDRDSKKITVHVPARIFRPGDYIVRIAAGSQATQEDIAAFSFSVPRP